MNSVKKKQMKTESNGTAKKNMERSKRKNKSVRCGVFSSVVWHFQRMYIPYEIYYILAYTLYYSNICVIRRA